MVYFYIITAIILSIGTIYFVIRSVDFRKFLAGAFFVSSGIQFYLSAAKIQIPLLGTHIVQPPEVSFVRGIIHFILFLLTFYFGFIRKQKKHKQ